METNTQHIESLYKALSEKLRVFIRHRISDQTAADDILQEVFLKIHDRIDTLRDREKIESWVFQIARNAVVDHYRNLKPSTQPDLRSGHRPDELVAVEEDEQDMHRKLASGLNRMIDLLPGPYREALKLSELEGLSQKELAKRLGISLSGAKSRVQRARSQLRDLLMQCCHFEFDRYGTVIDYHPISCCCCSPLERAT